MPGRVSLRDWPRITRFYGISPDVLARMPHALLEMYADSLIELTSEEALHGFLTADMPYAKASDRDRIIRSFEKYLDKPEAEAIDVRTDEGKQAAAGLGIAVIEEPSGIEST